MSQTDLPSGSRGRPSSMQQLRTWIATGTQSVGGGPSTLYLMRSILVRRGWITDQEFMQEWTLSRISLGNHMTALAALLGQRLGGRRGVVLAVTGMLVPAAAITIALTIGFDAIRNDPAVVAILAGVGPLTIGMMLGITAILVRSVLDLATPRALLDGAFFSFAVVAGFTIPQATIIIIVAGAVFGVLFLGKESLPPRTVED